MWGTRVVLQQRKAPLYPLPMISAPFRCIAMDTVGPFKKSSAGHQYILVLSDYAARYSEAFPLWSITTPKIIHALIQLYSRLGMPEEIRRNQLHHRHQNKFLPPTDGRTGGEVYQTLKSMLRKFFADTGCDWDKWLPFVLFAYREVPQASTGFSPFKLLYGWQVQGPFDLLRKTCEDPVSKPQESGTV